MRSRAALILTAIVGLLGACSIQIGSAESESGAHVEAERLLQAQYDRYLPDDGVDVECSFEAAGTEGIPITCTAEVRGEVTVYEGLATPLGLEVFPVGETVVYGRVVEPLLATDLPPGVTASCPDHAVVPLGEEYRCTISGSEEVAEVVMIFADETGTPESIVPVAPDGGEADVGGAERAGDVPILTG